MATEEKLAHLDSALKDCIKQINSLQEERELEMEQKEANKRLICSLVCKQELVDELERDKQQLEADLDELMARFDSVEKENAFLKCECCALERELMLHLESADKLAKLEDECQQLRLLVQRKLQGHGNDVGNSKRRLECNLNGALVARDSSSENSSRKFDILVDRLCDVEEENKALKEIIKARENELCSSKLKCAQIAYRLAVIEADNSKTVEITGSDLPSELEGIQEGVPKSTLMSHFIKDSDNHLEEHQESRKGTNELLEDSLAPQSDLHRSKSESELDVNIQSDLEEEITLLKLKVRSLECANKELETKLSLATEKNELLKRQLEESKESIGNLQEELEDLNDSKGGIEDQKLINEDLDTQLTVAKVKQNEMMQRLTSLEIELEDKNQCFEELEATCLELQLQLEILSRSGSPYLEEDQKQIGWEMIADCTKLAMIQATCTENSPSHKRVISATSSVVKKLALKGNGNQHYSLRDRMLADEDGGTTKDGVAVSPMENRALAVVPVKKRGGFGFIRKMFLRRRKCNTKKASTLLQRNTSSMIR